MATEAEIGVRSEDLIKYNKMGLKLTGLGEDGVKTYPRWTPIYNNPNYWTDEGLVRNISNFRYGVVTVFGLTRLSDEQGPLYLNVLDIDSDKVYHKLTVLMNPGPRYSLIKKLFEEGFVVKTKKTNGYHIYWLSHKLNKAIHPEDCKEDSKFEIKTDKTSGHTTLPPSRHREYPDFEYKFKVKSGIPTSDEAYDVIIEELKDCLKSRPEDPLHGEGDSGGEQKSESKEEYSGGTKKKDENHSGNGKSDGFQLNDEDISRIVKPIQPYYKKGCRNAIVFGLSGVLRRQGISKDSTIAVIENLASSDGISLQEDIRKAISVVEDTFKKDVSAISGTKYFVKDVVFPITDSRDIADEIFSKIFTVIHEVRDRGKDKEEIEDLTQWLTNNVRKEYTCHTMTDNEELLLYDERSGVYLTNQEWRIKSFCQSICHDVKTSVIGEVINRVKFGTYTDRSKFNSDIDIINLKNGLLNIHTLDFTDHSPKHLSTVQLPINYNPEAKCPKILKFLAEILEPEDIHVILQLIGYCLYKTNKYEKFFIFFGQGSNGKSTLIHLIERFLGYQDNISHQTLNNLATRRFMTAELYGKSANLCADIGNKKISNEHIGIIKMLTSGDRISAEKKNKDPFSFTPFAKLIFSANEIPELEDKTYSIWRRLILLEFGNIFEENKNVNLIDELSTKEEMSGLLNEALTALKQLIRDNQFDYTKDIETVRSIYEENSSTMLKFANQRLVPTRKEEDSPSCEDIQSAYVKFCKQENRTPKRDSELGTFLKMHFAGKWLGKQRKKINGVQKSYYCGLKLLGEDEQKLDSKW